MTEALSDPQPTPRCQAILAADLDARLTLGTTTSIPSIYYLRCWLTPTDAVATPVLGRFAPATEITDELHAVMASELYNTPRKPRAEQGLTP